MNINVDLLLAWGGVTKKHKKNDFIFYEGDQSRFYFQIVDGRVNISSHNEEGKKFTQGVFQKDESFGEPPLFIDEVYPASAIAETD